MSADGFDLNDYMRDIQKHAGGERIGASYTDFEKMMKYYNLSRLPDYENAAEPYLAYILMSRPSINMVVPGTVAYDSFRAGASDEGTVAYQNFMNFRKNTMTAAFANDAYGQQMLGALCRESSNPWLPVITTKAMSYTVGDMEIKTLEKGNTYFGHMIKYGKHSEEHKIAGSMSIDFRNDRYLSILKMTYLWMCYIYLVSKTKTIVPTMECQKNGILDYTGSLYYLVTRRDGREIVYWEKLVGVFPTKSPLSIFSFSDNMILEDRVSIDFAYSIRSDPCDPSILMDINILSGDTMGQIEKRMMAKNNTILTKTGYKHGLVGLPESLRDKQVMPNAYETPFVKGDVFATNPYIQMRTMQDGTIKYYLLWEKR